MSAEEDTAAQIADAIMAEIEEAWPRDKLLAAMEACPDDTARLKVLADYRDTTNKILARSGSRHRMGVLTADVAPGLQERCHGSSYHTSGPECETAACGTLSILVTGPESGTRQVREERRCGPCGTQGLTDHPGSQFEEDT